MAADPRTGVAGEFKFLPAAAEVKEFCSALGERQERLKRYAALPKFKPTPPTPLRIWAPGESPEEMFAKHGRPIGRFEGPSGYEPGERAPQSETERLAVLDKIDKANRIFFERECHAAGVSPRDRVCSPALERVLIEQGWVQRREPAQ